MEGPDVAASSPTFDSQGGSEQDSLPASQRKAYDHYLNVYLPAHEDSRPYAGEPDSEGYRKGFENFIRKIARWRELNPGEEDGDNGTRMDLDVRTLGCIPKPGRHECSEINKKLTSSVFSKVGASGLLVPVSGCFFEMQQSDCKEFRMCDDSYGAQFLVTCTVKSRTERFCSALVHMSIDEGEGCSFLAIAQPPFLAQFATARENNGLVSFVECTPEMRGLYVGHMPSGRMECGLVKSIRGAWVELLPPDQQGMRGASCLCAHVLLALPCPPSRLTYDLSVSVVASLSSVLREGKKDTHVSVKAQKVQLTML